GDIWLLRLCDNGDTLWTKTFGGSAIDEALSLRIADDGGVIIGGISQSFGGGWDAYLVRTHADGKLHWAENYGTTQSDGCHDIVQCQDGGFFFVGAVWLSGRFTAWIVRVDALGGTEWTQTYAGPYWTYFDGVDRCPDGGFVIAGATQVYGSGTENVHALRMDADGDTLWTRTYGRGGPSNFDISRSIKRTDDGNLVIAGESESPVDGSLDMWLLKIEGSSGEAVADPGDRRFSTACAPMIRTWPVPACEDAHVSFQLQESGDVTVEIYDLLGRRLDVLVDGWREAGEYRTTWRASTQPSGLYYARIQSGAVSTAAPVKLIRRD
ncbi:T9SS type A sorting domain-containing protein, partial [Candidatus Eisenbacteria bacterium]